jgi:hypothetical protein
MEQHHDIGNQGERTVKRLLYVMLAIVGIVTVANSAYVRPHGATRFQTLSAMKAPIPSLELDTEYNNLVTYLNNFNLTTNVSEWFDPSLSATWISANSFTVSGNQTGTFTPSRRFRATVVAGNVYSEVSTSVYLSGPNTTTVTILDSVLTNPITKVYHSILQPFASDGTISAKMIQTGGSIVSNLTGNVVGNVAGNLTGKAFGNFSGSSKGKAFGNFSGNYRGRITGSLVGNLTGNVTGNVTGNAGYAATTPWAGISSKPYIISGVAAPRVTYVGGDTGCGNTLTSQGIEDVGNGTIRFYSIYTYIPTC